MTIAANYSGQWDIVQATKKIGEKLLNGELKLDDVSEEVFENHLSLAGLPLPDLFIRTSGEQRISNFYLWQFVYAEFYFPTVCWPEFHEEEFVKALQYFEKRKRRFGKTDQQIEKEDA